METRTSMIKSKFSNAVHKLLNPNPVKNRDKWRQKETPLTDAQKIELFDQIIALDKETSAELGSYWYNRREKKRIHQARIKRGWVPKKKTPKSAETK